MVSTGSLGRFQASFTSAYYSEFHQQHHYSKRYFIISEATKTITVWPLGGFRNCSGLKSETATVSDNRMRKICDFWVWTDLAKQTLSNKVSSMRFVPVVLLCRFSIWVLKERVQWKIIAWKQLEEITVQKWKQPLLSALHLLYRHIKLMHYIFMLWFLEKMSCFFEKVKYSCHRWTADNWFHFKLQCGFQRFVFLTYWQMLR